MPSICHHIREHAVGIVVFISGLSILISGIVLVNPPYLQYFQLLVASQASIFAIVISVSAVSIQISSSEYSPLLAQAENSYEFINRYVLHFGISIFISIISLLIVNSSPPIELPQSLQKIGAASFASAATIYASYCFALLVGLKQDLLTAIDPEEYLSRQSESVTHSSFVGYQREKNKQGPSVKHPLLEIYLLAEQAIDERNPHLPQVALENLNIASKKPIKHSSDEYDFSDTFGYWGDLGTQIADQGMETVFRSWIFSINKVISAAVSCASDSVCKKGWETQRRVIERGMEADVVDDLMLREATKPLSDIIENERWGLAEYALSIYFGLVDTSLPKYNRLRGGSKEIVKKIIDLCDDAIKSDSEDYIKFSQSFEIEIIELTNNLLSPELHSEQQFFAEKLHNLALTSAKNNKTGDVKRFTRLLIELYFVTRHPDSVGARKSQVSFSEFIEYFQEIVDKGGTEGVYLAFEELEDYEEIDFEDYKERDFAAILEMDGDVNKNVCFSKIGDIMLNRSDAFAVMNEIQRELEVRSADYWFMSLRRGRERAGLVWALPD